MDIDALAGALGVNTLPDAAAAAAAPHAQLAPLGAFDAQPVVPQPAADGPSSLPAVHGVAAPVVSPASGSAAPASGGGISFKELVDGLRNDPTLSDAVKAQISDMSERYNPNDKQAFFSQLKALVGKERIKQVMIAIKRGAPGASGAADRPPKRGAPDSQEVSSLTLTLTLTLTQTLTLTLPLTLTRARRRRRRRSGCAPT